MAWLALGFIECSQRIFSEPIETGCLHCMNVQETRQEAYYNSEIVSLVYLYAELA